MMEHHYLIADDVDTEKIRRMESVVDADPYAVKHVARSASQANALLATLGERICGAAIDFDFLDETETGADIIRTARAANANMRIALVTAREGRPYEEASTQAMAAGADATFSSAEAFEGNLDLSS